MEAINLREYDPKRDEGVEYITRRFRGLGTKRYPIYTEAQAQARGMKYKYWKDKELANNDWALTDDGYVAQCRFTKEYMTSKKKIRPRKYVALICGREWVTDGTTMEYIYNRDHGRRYNTTGKKDPTTVLMRRELVKRAVDVYATQVVSGKIDLALCGKIMLPNTKDPAGYFKYFLKKQGVKERVDKLIAQKLEDNGISVQFAIDILKKAAVAAEVSGKTKELLDVYAELKELVGLTEKMSKVTTTERVELSSSTSRLLEDGGDSLRLERVTEVPYNEN